MDHASHSEAHRSRRLQVLVVGSGGREHALVWKLLQSPRVARVMTAPGNAGTAASSAGDGPHAAHPSGTDARASNLAIEAHDVAGLVSAALRLDIDLVVIGPEAPLAAGLADALIDAGVPVFGPQRAPAQLECSKAFAKQFMLRHHIPTAAAAIVDDVETARAWLAQHPGPVVVKASGLAAGKGVVVCDTTEEALAAVVSLMEERVYGDAGATLLLEERLEGEEVSILAFCDGHVAAPMPPAQDHKRAYEGDQGPNTGGMGAYAPALCVDAALMQRIEAEVLRPALVGMRAEGYPFIGVLFAGLMLTAKGPKVLEFNCRFGDPETEALMLLLDSDLLEILLACVQGRLEPQHIRWHTGSAVAVVLAAPGYPGSYPKGEVIAGLDVAGSDPAVAVFHAGTQRVGDDVVTAGGRVLAVTARDEDLALARDAAYRACDRIAFVGKQLRRDIGHRGLGPPGTAQRRG